MAVDLMVGIDERENLASGFAGPLVSKGSDRIPGAVQDDRTRRSRCVHRPVSRAMVYNNDLNAFTPEIVRNDARQAKLQAGGVISNGNDE